MIPLRWRATLNGLRRYPLQSLLAVLGLALGVMVFVAVDIANQSARRAFTLSVDTLAGRATHQIVAGPDGVPDALYVALRRDLGVREAAPVIELLARHEDTTVRLLGVDPLAERGFRGFLEPAALAPGVWRRLLLEPGAALASAATAARLQLAVGDAVTLRVGGRAVRLELAGVLGTAAGPGLDEVLLVDIATAQELLGRGGRLSRIDLVLPADDPGPRARIERLLPPDGRIVPSTARARAVDELTRAFRLNLTAMSLLAVVIGLFLIYNAMHFTVLRRRALIGTLRALGMTRGELLAALLGEALLLGLTAAGLGIAAGAAIAGQLLSLVSRTINDLYFTVSVRTAGLDWDTATQALALGVIGSLVSAALPALEAVLTAPVETIARRPLERRAGRWLPALAAGGGLVLLGAWTLVAASVSLGTGFAALALLLLGCSLLVPWSTAAAAGALARACGGTVAFGRYLASGIGGAISRTGVAASALAVALAATVGVAVMIGSFRAAVQEWLGSSLRADIYVAPAGGVPGRPETVLDARLAAQVRDLPAVAGVSRGRFIDLDTGAGTLPLFAVDLAPQGYDSIRLLEGGEAAWRAFDRDNAVLVSEPFAWHRRLRAGDPLRLPTRAGEREFRVAGVYRDYGSDQGVVMLRLSLYREHWNDQTISSLGVYLHPEAQVARVMSEIRGLDRGAQQVRLRSNRELREASLAVFDRTFEITRVLRWLTVIVAGVAILTALSALQLERRREFALLRSLGMTRLQLGALTLMQTLLLGLIAGLLALPIGLALAWLLVDVINRRAFGWSMDLVLRGTPLLEALSLALAAALAAGLVPAWRAARDAPAPALRGE